MNLLAAGRAVAMRIREDVASEDRRARYERLLASAQDHGYELISLSDFKARLARGDQADRWLVLRHDVDISDVVGNESFFKIERSLAACSTFYFRLSTAPSHQLLISQLLQAGFEVGYHFEEAATIAKRYRLRTREEVLDRRDEIRDLFRRNSRMFRQRWNPDLRSVASHGDWINRRLRTINNEFVSAELLAECDLLFEAYDPAIMSAADVYISDVATPPEHWAGGYGLEEALRDRRDPIYLLTHERRWNAAIRAAVTADLHRLVDGARYALGR